MEIISLQENQEQAFEKAEAIIKDGGLVVVPTDTVYGIIGDTTQGKTIERLYELKQRPQENAFPVFVKDIATARWFAYIADAKARFLENVWPGSVTVVFHHKEKLPQMLTADKDTIALRIPKHPFLMALLARINIPLVQSSANISGMPVAETMQEIATLFEHKKEKPDLLIDGGKIFGAPSTIIDFTTNNPKITRSGLMKKEDIDALFAKIHDIPVV